MPNCPAPADIDYLYPLPPRSHNRGRERSLHLRRLAKAVQPVTQAHQRMFPHHARPGVTHHDADQFAAVALVAMHGTIGARRLFHAEAAALQPHCRHNPKTASTPRTDLQPDDDGHGNKSPPSPTSFSIPVPDARPPDWFWPSRSAGLRPARRPVQQSFSCRYLRTARPAAFDSGQRFLIHFAARKRGID